MDDNEIYLLADKFANKANHVTREEFLSQMRKLHPTMQQIFAGLILAWLEDFTQNYHVDYRNKYSVEHCRKVLNAFGLICPEEQLTTRFPCI